MGNPYRARKTVKTRAEAKPSGVVVDRRPGTGEEPGDDAVIDLTVEASTVSQLPVEPIPDTVRGLRVWIGDNPELAQMILDIEQASDEPRKTVVEHCQRVLRNG